MSKLKPRDIKMDCGVQFKLIPLLIAAILAVGVCSQSYSGNRVLVLLDDMKEQAKYTKLWNGLEGIKY